MTLIRAWRVCRSRRMAWRSAMALFCIAACGRIGFDRLGNGSGSDDSGAPTDVDLTVCPPECNACDFDGTCNIDCTAGCTDVTCPPDRPCNVFCRGAASCPNVSCGLATRCYVECGVSGACQQVTCGTAQCTVYCAGTNACSAIECSSSCYCYTYCSGPNTCQGPTTCPSGCQLTVDVCDPATACNRC